MICERHLQFAAVRDALLSQQANDGELLRFILDMQRAELREAARAEFGERAHPEVRIELRQRRQCHRDHRALGASELRRAIHCPDRP